MILVLHNADYMGAPSRGQQSQSSHWSRQTALVVATVAVELFEI